MRFWNPRKEKVACVDSCFILGDFLEVAREYKKVKTKKERNYKTEIKPTKRLKEILENGSTLLISPITKYEILANIISKEGLDFTDAKHLYDTTTYTKPSNYTAKTYH